MNHAFPFGRLDTHQSVAYTGTAGTITNAVGNQTYRVRILVTTAAYVKVGKGVTATTSDVYFPAGIPEDRVIAPGEVISAIQVSANGVLHVTEIF